MRIGLPQAFGFHYYRSLWKIFLTELGFTVIQSGGTNKEILHQGLAVSPSEACLPLKCFMGHVLSLIPRADYLFIPRLVCLQHRPAVGWGCPKYIALPDMVKAVSPNTRIISPCIDCRKTTIRDSFAQSVKTVGVSRKKALSAFDIAHDISSSAKARSDFGTFDDEKPLTIALLGHAYLINDPFLSLDLKSRIKALGCRVIDYSAYGSSAKLKSKRHPLSWYFEEDILLSAEKLLGSSHIDGIVYLLSFGCGAGSITSEIIHLEIRTAQSVPLLRVIIDEHTAEAGLNTRLESYIDMLNMRKETV